MAIDEVRVKGIEYLALATGLLQRARLADADAGVWEAADLQWWWRTPRASDTIDQVFWIDDEGPVAGVVCATWSTMSTLPSRSTPRTSTSSSSPALRLPLPM